jgi:hypothetical protein
VTQWVQKLFLFCRSLILSFFVEFFAWHSVNSSLNAGSYSVPDFYAEVLSLLNVSADLVCTAVNNVLLVSTGLCTAGLGLGHVGLGLGLGLGTVGLGLGLGLD